MFITISTFLQIAGNCLLASEPYEDTAENFENAKHEMDWMCVCNQGYETYYSGNGNNAIPPDEEKPYCNAELVITEW